MNELHEPAKTIAVLALQSPVLCVEDDKWQRVAELLALRLHHPVAVVDLASDGTSVVDLQSTIEWYAKQGYGRVVVLPVGLESFDLSTLIPVVAWMRAEHRAIQLHVARSWTAADWADALMPAIGDAMSDRDARMLDQESKPSRAVLFVGPDCVFKRDDPSDPGLELASLVYHCQQRKEQLAIRYCFMSQRNPDLAKAIGMLDSSRIEQIVLVPWRMNSSEYETLMRKLGELHETEFSNLPVYSGCIWDRFSRESPTAVELLERPSWMHIALGHYLDALANRPLERYFTNAGCKPETMVVEHALIALDQRIDAMLPSEYQGRTEEVSPQSMGSVSIPSTDFGKVPWDEIWTSFCDLAMAGGPPHRGRLLEAVTAEEVKADLEAYGRVVAEIIRGIEMVTGLKTVQSSALGWVGIECDDEAMAAWLMRAIIVENVMVRREGAVLYLPAGPAFTVKREIKNVITAVAKTVHYWRAHLRQRV